MKDKILELQNKNKDNYSEIFKENELLRQEVAFLKNELIKEKQNKAGKKLFSEKNFINDVERQFNNRFNFLLENAPTGITFLRGESHVYEFANSLYYNLVGNRNIIGKPIREALPELKGQGIYELYDEVYNSGKAYFGNEVPVSLDKKNNGILEKTYFNFVYQPVFNENNNVEGISVFAFDVTAHVLARNKLELLTKKLTKSQEKYKKLSESLELKVQKRTNELSKANKEIEYQRNKLNDLFMNSSAVICVFSGPEHIYELSNPAYQKITGNRNLIGKPIREALPELKGQGLYEVLDEVYKTGKTYIGNEIPVMIDKGKGIPELIYFNFVYQPVFNNENKVEGISVFAFDVSEQVISRQKVENLYKELERSNESLRSFAYIASHDLQEPLRVISSYTGLLARRYKDSLDNNAGEFIEFILSGTKRMKLLIESILDHSKIQLKEGENIQTDLNNVVESVKENLEVSFKENDVTLNYTELPVVRAKQSYMIQIFQNIINNSIKYRKKDESPNIHIGVKKKKNFWEISITDNGIGIEEQYFERIFQIFQRLHSRSEYEGTGIGLANCKKIIELYGGKIWVESIKDVGTTFHFTLPV